MVKINNWYGRFGNNVTQLINALHIGYHLDQDRLDIPNHKYFESMELGGDNSDVISNSKNHFFSSRKSSNYSDEVFNDNRERVLETIRKSFKLTPIDLNLGDNDLIIHVRSGDINSINPHPGFIQPPLDFYIKVIESRKWDKIYIICEDDRSPVIPHLLEKYDNIIFEINNLNQDMDYILNSKNLCFGFGSFIPALLIFNTNIKNIYYPEYCWRFLLEYTDCNHITYDIPNYIKKGEWKNTPQQREFMVNYKLD
jgi:hypothetical protein